MPVISLTTDFGSSDGYSGVMKAVIAGIAPQAQVIDLSHSVPDCDIEFCAWVLDTSFSYFPNGSIHVAVVDPGVGSDRKAIIVTNGDHSFVGPDNGVFSLILGRQHAWTAFELNKPQYFLHPVSNTFHGRDIFAPIAARLAQGSLPQALGYELPIDKLTTFKLPGLARIAGRLVGQVAHIDKFGNLITNIPNKDAADSSVCILGERAIELGKTYSSAEPGEVIAYGGSHGYIEIGVSQGNAKLVLAAEKGNKVSVE